MKLEEIAARIICKHAGENEKWWKNYLNPAREIITMVENRSVFICTVVIITLTIFAAFLT